MTFCPRCGKESTGGDVFCRSCGQPLSSANLGYQNQAQIGNWIVPDKSKGLSELKNAFLLYVIGGVMGLVPVVGIVGAVLELIGLIFLIIGLRTLGKTALASSKLYWSAGKWLIYAIVIGIIIVVVGAIAVTAVVFASYLGGALVTGTSSPTLPARLFTGLFEGILVVAASALVPFIYAWNKVRVALAHLGEELEQQRVRRGGQLFFLASLIGLSALVLLYYVTLSSPSPDRFLSTFSSFGFDYSYLIVVVGDLVLLIGSYLCFNGISAALRSMQGS